MLQSLCVISVKCSIHCPMQGIQKVQVGAEVQPSLLFFQREGWGWEVRGGDAGLPVHIAGLLLSLLGDLN